MDVTTIGFVSLSAVLLLVIARGVYQLILGVSMTEALIHHDNKAAAIALAGFLLGVIQVIIPVFSGPTHSFWQDLANVATYGFIGILVLTISGLIFTAYCQVTGTDLKGQIAQGNVAAGITAAGAYLAVSELTRGIFTGDGGALLPTIVFWVAGLVALIVLTHLFRLLTAYDDATLIGQGNVAAALGFAGLLVAMGMMVGHSVAGTFTGYQEGFTSFGLFLLLTLLFYPVRQIVVQMIMLGGGFSLYNGRLDHEIAEDHNVGAGVLEAVGYIATALVLTHI